MTARKHFIHTSKIPPNTCGIYKITCTQNDKSYIGQSIDIANRWRTSAKKGLNSLIKADIELYGIESFELSVVELCEIEQLDEREIFWINELDTINSGYNMQLRGFGKRFTPEEVAELNARVHTPKPREGYVFYMPNVAEDELNPYEYRLLAHFTRLCGDEPECWFTLREITEFVEWSVNTVIKATRGLVEKGFIETEPYPECTHLTLCYYYEGDE